MHACIAINALVSIPFLRKARALIRCFCKLQKIFHHSSSTLVGEIFELSLINRKGGSTTDDAGTSTHRHSVTDGTDKENRVGRATKKLCA